MAETKERKIVRADGTPAKKPAPKSSSGNKPKNTNSGSGKKVQEAAPVGNATGLRVGAIILWVAAIAFEVLAILVLFGKINLTFLPQIWQLIIFIVLDLVCLIIGSQLWKKANHIDPASEKNQLKFWLWNNMGVIVAAFAFIPFIILTLTNKTADKKTKTIATVAAAVALLIGGAASIDYNPVSAEEKAAAMEEVTGDVYWSPFGHVYHTHDDCQALANSETLTVGDVEQAIASNRTRLCAFCAKKDDITNVRLDEITEAIVDEVELEPEAAPAE
ncbi:MAG: hypothetical protein IJL78_00745 [Lachnospiraceae bacterium]|nr:hypothetical protein [Lachnospiraceae bacterium]